MPTPYTWIDAQRLLIQPLERVRFVIVFILATQLSASVAYFLINHSSSQVLRQLNPTQYAIAAGILVGSFRGTAQWFVLRRFIASPLWIGIVTLMTTLAFCVQAWMDPWHESLMNSSFPNQGMIVYMGLSRTLGIGLTLSLGFLQWVVLRAYVVQAEWWIFFPLIASLFKAAVWAGIFMIPVLGLSKFSSTLVFLLSPLTVLAGFEAIGFCFLRKKSNSLSVHQSPLAIAPDLVNFRQIKSLSQQLYLKISRTWIADLPPPNRPLIFLVGVDSNGTLVAYEPMNLAANDRVEETPLPHLANAPNSSLANLKQLPPLAKFQMRFIPPGYLDITSCRGIPIFWLGIGIYFGLLGLTFIESSYRPFPLFNLT